MSNSAMPRLYVIGDSISIQYGPYLEKELAGRFYYDRKRDRPGEAGEANLDVPTGANGGDSSMVLAYLKYRREHEPITADVLLLNCGLHDIKTTPGTQTRQVPPDLYEQNLRAILAEATAMGLRVIWVRTTPVIDQVHNSQSKSFHRFAADVERYNAIADRVMAEAGVRTIDLHSFCQPLLPGAFIDHVHYSDEARAKQAAFIATQLLE